MRCKSTTKYRGEILRCEDQENHAACHYHLNIAWSNKKIVNHAPLSHGSLTGYNNGLRKRNYRQNWEI